MFIFSLDKKSKTADPI